MACWLLRTWEEKNDPRSKRADRFALAQKIAEGKGVRIWGADKKIDRCRLIED